MTGLISALQQSTAEGQRGKAFAIAGVAASAGQAVGMLVGGILGDPLGLVTVLNAQGALYLVAGVLAMVWLTAPASVRRRWVRRSSSPAPTSAPGSSATTTA